jgi:hypothetical protein
MDFNAARAQPCEQILFEHCYGYRLSGEFIRIVSQLDRAVTRRLRTKLEFFEGPARALPSLELFQVSVDEFGHLKHVYLSFAIKERLEFFVGVNLALIGLVLQPVSFDVIPNFFGKLSPGQWVRPDNGGQLLIRLHRLGEC